MEDSKIIDLYWARSELAISETSKKYSRYCHYISYNILHNNEDAEECVNDTYMHAWNSIPPMYPNRLSTFLGKITRNLSLDKYKRYTTQKRGLGQIELSLSEIEECIPAVSGTEQAVEAIILVDALNGFLSNLPQIKRILFVQRYWYLMSIKEISEQCNMSQSKIKSMLFRIRNELKLFLEKEGIIL